ncbi:GNAT family N-acetyltransferase [Haliea atlantica]|nr:GNAT family N-acetyltransferase [Haliea sp.]MAL95105.1 GNAT family N-acetyltransferase [Haliea sp.]
MSQLHIRPVRPTDCPLILRFIRDLAEYERALEEVEATEAQLQQLLFGDNPKVHGLICESDGEAVGFALYFYNFSSWLGRLGIFLEDLYVDPAHRGKGAGKALLQHLARQAVTEGCGRFEWNVLDWNEPAIRFYESFGARPQSEWVGYRLTGEALERFAGE